MSMLAEAVERGDLAQVRALIAGGDRPADAAEALADALWRGDLAVAEHLIDAGVGVVAGEDDMSPLHVAARKGLVGLMRKLIEKGAPLDHRAYQGSISPTPLMSAVDEDQPDAVRLLWRLRPPSREELGSAAWHWIRLASGRAAVVLAEETGDPNLPSCFGFRPLHNAVLGRDVASVKALLAMGADPAATTGDKLKVYQPFELEVKAGSTPLDLAVASRKKKGEPALVEIEALLAPAKPAKKASAGKVAKAPKVELSRVMVTVAGDHRHPGARAIPDRYAKGMFCAFCGSARAADHAEVIALAEEQVDARALPLFNARWDYLREGVTQDHVKSMGRIARALGNKVDALPRGALWKSTSLTGRSDPLRAKIVDDRMRPEDDAEAQLFTQVLAAEVAGKDDLSVLGPALGDPDAKVACAAARLLRQDRVRMPAWFYNPKVPVDPALLDRVEAVREGRAEPFTLWSPEREMATARLLVGGLADARLEVAFSAAGSLGPWGVPTAANHPVWTLLPRVDHERTRDALLALLDRAASTGAVPVVMGDVQSVIAHLLGKLPAGDRARLRALGKALGGGRLAWLGGELSKLGA
ncbi:MAG: ankyrin repeat domain-containing protein [Byssovorax sp.]